MPFCSLAEEDKSTESKTEKTETESSKKKEQEIKNVYIHLFEGQQNITKEDLEQNNLLIKMPAKEIIINKKANTYGYTAKSEPLPDTHSRNQQPFLEKARRIENAINREAGKKKDNSFGIDPFNFPFIEPSNNW
jgi:hypothetical protein